MSRARNIKPGFFKNDLLAELIPEYRLLFIGLWCEADREGRLQYRPKKLRANIFPYDMSVDVSDGIAELQDRDFLVVYEVDGVEYVQIANWAKHQNPHHKEIASEIPALAGHVDTVCTGYVPLNNSIRARIYARDGRVCRECGATHGLSIDHIKPVSRGGNSVDDNLQVLCLSCNSRKGNRIPITEHGKGVDESCMDDGQVKQIVSCPTDSLIPDSLIPRTSTSLSTGAGAQAVETIDPNTGEILSVVAAPSPAPIANLTANQSAQLVMACKALRKMGAIRFHVGDEGLAALMAEGFTAEQVVRVVGEKALRDSGVMTDIEVNPEVPELLINGATQRDMGLTDKQHTALRGEVSKISAAYIAAALRGRRDEAQREKPAPRQHRKPSATDSFEGKKYVGTPDDQLKPEFRAALAANPYRG
jgi:hypothetical protein